MSFISFSVSFLLFKIAINELTPIPSVPSLNNIFSKIPSSTDSISIVALSVSTSAIISPGFTSSPIFLHHFARLPSVIVGDNAGISIGIAIFILLFIFKNS